MPLTRFVLLNPLAQCLFVGPALLVTCCQAYGLTTVEGSKTITAATSTDSYRITSGSTLTANGATTLQIQVDATGRLGTQKASISATGTDAIRLSTGAEATLGGDTRVTSDRYGIRLSRTAAVGSRAVINDSHVEGRSGGALVSAASSLTLRNSELIGSGTATAAVLFGNARLEAEGSKLTGASEGLHVFADSEFAESAKVNLLGSQVEGKDGSAILVGNSLIGPAQAQILVGAGSTLIGSNGVLLEVVGNSSALMTVDNSALAGDVRAEAGSTANLVLDNRASLVGRLDNVAGLTLTNDSQWTMVEDSQIGSLAINGSSIRFGEPGQYQRLTVGTLAGAGTFIMDADFSTGQTDFLDVTGTATGNHALLVGSSGADPVAESQLQVVRVGAGDAQFSLLNGPVDLGAFSYELVQRGNGWFLDGSSKVISPGTASVLALFNTAPTVWYGELTSLRGRMGEVRRDQGKAGAWARAYGNKYNVSDAAGSPYQQVQQGFSLGADAPLRAGDGQWLLGVMAGHSSSELDLIRGATAQVKSSYIGLYGTWLDAQTGYYFDSTIKFNHFDNSAKVSLSDGQRTKSEYSNLGVGVSLELGRHIELGDGYFIEPFTQWSAVTIGGKDYHLDNGLQAKGDDTQSVLGKVGTTLGRTLELGGGQFVQPYVRLAYAHEFVTDNEIQVNEIRFDNDLSGSRGEVGAGIAVALSERLQLHADFDYANGDKIEQPWGANLGLQYRW